MRHMAIFEKETVTCQSLGILGTKHCPTCNKETVWLLCVARTWYSVVSIRLIPYRKDYRAACAECRNGLTMSKDTFDVLKMKMDCGDTIGRIEDAIRFPDKSALQIREILKSESEEREMYLEMEELEREESERVRAAEEEAMRNLAELEAEIISETGKRETSSEDTDDKV